MKRKKPFRVALGSICLALTIVFMFAASFVPGIELTLFAVSSLFTAVMLLEAGVGSALLMYAAAVILGIILLPNKLAIIPYGFFFGYYGILKYYIEKINGMLPQLVLKLLLYAAVLCIGVLVFGEILIGSVIRSDLPAAAIIAGGMIMLLLYDYIFTMLINQYRKRIRKDNLDNFKLS